MDVKLHDVQYVPFYKRISYLYIPAFFVLITVLMEIVMFAVMGLSFPSAYIFSLSIIFVIATIAAMVRIKWVQTVICSIFLGWHLFTTISNIIAFQTCNEIFSLETFKTLVTAFNNAGAVEVNLWFLIPVIFLIIVYVVAVVLTMVFCHTPKAFRTFKWQKFLCGVLAFVSFSGYTIAYAGLPGYDNSTYVPNLSNRRFIYDTFSNRVGNLQAFGSYSYYLDNLLALIGGKPNASDIMHLEINESFSPSETVVNANEVLGEGYNLITVLMETFERQAINSITMPNLYQFMQESCIDVNGYYSMERTCVTDHISQTGMHPYGKEYWNTYEDVVLPNSLANIFKRSNYDVNSFHNTSGRCYDRNDFFEETIGFDNFYNYYEYDNPRYDGEFSFNSDELLFKENLEKIAPADRNFYSYVISVTTHSLNAKKFDLHEYHPEEFAFIESQENWDQLTKLYPVLLSNDPVEVLTAKNYLAGTMSFDKGFGALIDYLKTTEDASGKKLIETTAILMFGDHYYYANPNGVLGFETEDARKLAGNRCPLIIYNPRQIVNGIIQAENALKVEPAKHGKTLNRFTSTMDIYPTICSLFGIETDQQLTYGRSIFSQESSIGVTYLSGYIFGVDGYTITEKTDNISGQPHIEWNLWRTLDFVEFNGIKLTAKQIKDITPQVNRVYDSILIDTKLYNQDGFENLQKAYYQLGKSNLI